MPRWEYCLVKHHVASMMGSVQLIYSSGERKKISGNDPEGVHLARLFNQLGEQGWEVAAAGSAATGAGLHLTFYTLKRPY